MIQLPSNNEIDNVFYKADYLKRIVAGLIDGALIIAFILLILISEILPNEGFPPSFILLFPIIPFLFLALYRLISLFLFNGTLGMKICKLILLNKDLLPLSKQEIINAAFFLLINDVRYYDK
ncbi:hypothetical protein C3K47_08055 [Solitalea longa]|uniref:RDD domain-containing protein n=1 Tax=Solitalea longa TaxID=2079460 RepID=A0A2S5A4G7_9SPHI|nr:RDD family protein [Solitalea longa]POY37003.1 hypothetical protein C3K47_08055 [Solitalea longa]